MSIRMQKGPEQERRYIFVFCAILPTANVSLYGITT